MSCSLCFFQQRLNGLKQFALFKTDMGGQTVGKRQQHLGIGLRQAGRQATQFSVIPFGTGDQRQFAGLPECRKPGRFFNLEMGFELFGEGTGAGCAGYPEFCRAA